MSDPIPDDIRTRLAARLNGGGYRSEDEVLRDALDALDLIEEERATRWRERNELAVRQSQAGMSQPLDDAAVLGRLRERLARDGVGS